MSLLSRFCFGHDEKEYFSRGLQSNTRTLVQFDLTILQELQADGRLTNTELAQHAGLSATPCWRCVQTLEAGNYIQGCRAKNDRHNSVLDVLAFVPLDHLKKKGKAETPVNPGVRRSETGYPAKLWASMQPGFGTNHLNLSFFSHHSSAKFNRWFRKHS